MTLKVFRGITYLFFTGASVIGKMLESLWGWLPAGLSIVVKGGLIVVKLRISDDLC